MQRAITLGVAVWTILAQAALAGSYSENFTAYTNGTTSLTNAECSANTTTTPTSPSGSAVQSTCAVHTNVLRLTSMLTNSTNAAFKIADLDAGQEISEFTVTFKVRQDYVKSPSIILPAEGWSLNFGPIPNNYGNGELGFAMSSGLTIGWDTGSGGDPTSLEVFAGGVSVGNFARSWSFDTNYRTAIVHWEAATGLDVTWNAQSTSPIIICTDLPTPNFSPKLGSTFAFSGRTGPVQRQDTTIDDIVITTVPVVPIATTGPIISEILADNTTGVEDEDCDKPDWIELYNGTAAPINVGGYYLTDSTTNLTQWQIPTGTTIPATSYLWFFASGKNRPTAARPHTSFSLSKDGGKVLLVAANGTTILSEVTYAQQVENISYGIRTTATDYSYLETPTPGGKNFGAASLGPPLESVVASRGSGILTAANTLSFSPPVTPGAVVRYTTNNTTPTATSTVYTTPINLTASTVVQARVFLAGRLPGPLRYLNFAMIGSDLSNYQGSGQPFSSNLPIVVIDSFLNNIDSVSSSTAPRPYRYTYATIFDTVHAGRSKIFTDLTAVPVVKPQYDGISGFHVRGSSSSGFPQLSYGWETWNDKLDDKEEGLLDLPSDSDWVLYAPYNDKTLMRNVIAYNSMLALRGGGSAMRTRFVEVFFNQNDGTITNSDYRGVYVLIEKIKRGRERVNIEKLTDCMTAPELISGGYIFKKDRIGANSVTFGTTTTQAWGSQTLELVEPEAATPVQAGALQTWMQGFENSLNAATWANQPGGYRDYIDPLSFCDNHLWIESFKQIDGFRLSAFYSKDRGGKVNALPIWDYNLSLGNSYYAIGDQIQGWYYSTITSASYPYYSRLQQDPEFVMQYWDRYWQLRRGPFAEGKLQAMMDTNAALLNESQARHFAKWNILGQYQWPNPNGWKYRNTFVNEVAWMKEWLRQRLNWMDYNSLAPQGTNLMPPEIRANATKVVQYGGNVAPGFAFTMDDPNRSAAGEIIYTINGPDPRQWGGTQDAAALTFSAPAPTPVTPVNSGATWKYLDGNAAAPAGTWKNAGFDDSLWPSAAGKFGYGDSQTTTLAAGALIASTNTGPDASVNPATYFRTTFNVANAAQTNALWLELNVDDGAVVYLNGQEAVRFNMPYAPALIDRSSQATNALDAAYGFETTFHPLKLNPALLVEGVNTLAVEVHQVVYDGVKIISTGVQPDMAFDVRLKSLSHGWSATPVTLANTGTHVVRARLKQGANWSPLTEATFVVGAVPATAANVVVSEVHYHPAEPSAAELALGFNKGNDFEFIELLNISQEAVDLSGVTLASAVAFDFTLGVASARYLLPSQRVLVVENLAAFAHRHPSVSSDRIAGAYTGNLSNSGARIMLLAANGGVIKDFTYNDKEPWPVAADGPLPPLANTGADFSLVLNNPFTNPDHTVPANWRASGVAGGNPGGADGMNPPANPTGDDDGDGILNLVEHVTGKQPLPTPVMQLYADPLLGAAPTPHLYFRIPRRLDSDGFTLAVEWAEDLATWAPAALTYDHTDYTTSPPQQVWRSNAPASLLPPRLFLRGKVTTVLP